MKILAILCFVYLSFFQNMPLSDASAKTRVAVSIPPQIYFVERIGGDLVDVMCMIPKGASPHIYEPSPMRMKLLSGADMYVRIRIDFENAWWEKIAAANSRMLAVDSTRGIELLDENVHQQIKSEHNAGNGGIGKDASQGGKGIWNDRHNPHIWLSPRMVKRQAENICQGLIKIDSEHRKTYKSNKEDFIRSLNILDNEIRTKLADLKTRHFMVFHPTWSFIAKDYDLEQISIEIEGKEPGAREMVRLAKIAAEKNISVIFLQPQNSRRTADAIARHIGARVKILDPLAADWMKNMRRVADVFAETLSLKGSLKTEIISD